MNSLKENKTINIISKILKVLFIILLIAFIIVVCLQRFSDNKISFFKYRMFTVVSGSMEPKYKIGDVLISKDVKADKIKVGDTITYEGKKGDFKDKVITHQVIRIDKDDDGKLVFHTQGLANLVEDPDVYEEQIYGVVKYKVLILSFIYKVVSTKIGFYLFIIIPIMFMIGSEIISTLLDREEKRRR